MNSDNEPCTVIDYQLGNVASVVNMIQKVGGKAIVSSSKEEILKATKLILPGVGAFDHGIEQLYKLDFFTVIQDKVTDGTPLLGICLGMQLLAHSSEEGNLSGLGLIDAEFKKFSFDTSSNLRVPHVGWNNISIVKSSPLFLADSSKEQRFYFTHSYYAVCSNTDSVLATTEYGNTFPSMYHHNHIYGAQFHPEKSHRFGMVMIKNFLDI